MKIKLILILSLILTSPVWGVPTDSTSRLRLGRVERPNLNQAKKLFQEGNISEARTIWFKTLESGIVDSDRFEALYYLAETEEKIGDKVSRFEELVSSGWSSAWGLLARKELYYLNSLEGDFESSLSWFESFKNVDTDQNMESYIGLLLSTDRSKEAVKTINKLLKDKDVDSILLVQIEAYRQTGKPNQAKKILQKFQSKNPFSSQSDMLTYLLALLEMEENTHMSKIYLEQLFNMRPDTPVSILSLKELETFD